MDNIDSLLQAAPSAEAARQLVEWANQARDRVARGDMMIGVLPPEEIAKIPAAYRAAGEMGDANVWIELAWWYAHPNFGQSNLDAAEKALQEALAAKSLHAVVELVKIRWFFARETATDAQKEETFRMAAQPVDADPTNSEAVYFLALLTTHGFGVGADAKAGFALQQKAGDLGNADALFELFIHYANGLGVEANQDAARDACRKSADAGNARAMYNLGAFAASGRGVPKNIPEAIDWYEKAAALCNPSAMAGLAVIYATGDGVEADRDYAEQMLDRAEYCGLDVQRIRKRVGM